MSYPYCYFVYNKSQTKRAVIMPWGVTIEYLDGGIMDTNIRPERLYPGKRKLSRKQRLKIAKSAVEGVYYSPTEVEMIYRIWQQKGQL